MMLQNLSTDAENKATALSHTWQANSHLLSFFVEETPLQQLFSD